MTSEECLQAETLALLGSSVAHYQVLLHTHLCTHTHLLKDALALEASGAGLPRGWGQALSSLTGGHALREVTTSPSHCGGIQKGGGLSGETWKSCLWCCQKECGLRGHIWVWILCCGFLAWDVHFWPSQIKQDLTLVSASEGEGFSQIMQLKRTTRGSVQALHSINVNRQFISVQLA